MSFALGDRVAIDGKLMHAVVLYESFCEPGVFEVAVGRLHLQDVLIDATRLRKLSLLEILAEEVDDAEKE